MGGRRIWRGVFKHNKKNVEEQGQRSDKTLTLRSEEKDVTSCVSFLMTTRARVHPLTHRHQGVRSLELQGPEELLGRGLENITTLTTLWSGAARAWPPTRPGGTAATESPRHPTEDRARSTDSRWDWNQLPPAPGKLDCNQALWQRGCG